MRMTATSDWHGDKSTAGVDRFDDISAAIDKSIDAAIEFKADAYLMCGDLTDPNTTRSHRAVAKAVEVQRRLDAEGIHPIFVAGNHDVIEDGSGVTTMSALAATGIGTVFEKPGLIALKGVHIIALPFTEAADNYDPEQHIRLTAEALNLATKVDKPVLIVGHLNLEGITPGSETVDMPRGRNVFWPMKAIKECFPKAIVVGGHYHKPQEYDGVQIIGSIVRLRFDEWENETGYMALKI